ncbi:MAG: Hpt domain-containing protein [Thiohalomonadaceae bacterium]
MNSSLAVYDRALALEQAGGSAELADDLFTMLMQELPVSRALLQDAFGIRDFTALLRHAHKLHGATLYTGVSALRAAVAELELHLKRAETEPIPRLFETVLGEIDRVLALDETCLA